MAVRPEHAPHFPHIPHIDINPLKKAGLIAGAVTLGTAGVGLAAQMLFGADRGPSAPPPEPNRASDTIKPPEGGQQVVIIPNPSPEAQAGEGNLPVEVVPLPVTVAPPPQESAVKPEIPPFDCGILSPEACASGQYVKWILPSKREVYGIAFNLKKGAEIKITAESQVAASKGSEGLGYSITAVNRKSGERLEMFGDFKPAKELTNTGKNLPAGSIIAESDESGSVAFRGTNIRQVVSFSGNETLKAAFKAIIADEARLVYTSGVEPTPTVNPDQIKIFFDVPVAK